MKNAQEPPETHEKELKMYTWPKNSLDLNLKFYVDAMCTKNSVLATDALSPKFCKVGPVLIVLSPASLTKLGFGVFGGLVNRGGCTVLLGGH